MKTGAAISWPRIGAEAAAIVASILLAFAIDTWWQQRSNRAESIELARDLIADFEASQRHVEVWAAGNLRLRDELAGFLDALSGAEDGTLVEVPETWLIAAVAGPTYSPTESALQAAISSGKLELIDDAELRKILASWRTLLEDTREDEVLIRQIVVNELVPVLSEQVRLHGAFDNDVMLRWFQDGQAGPGTTHALRVDSRIIGALSERLFYTNFVVTGLTDLEAVQAGILAQLERYVASE